MVASGLTATTITNQNTFTGFTTKAYEATNSNGTSTVSVNIHIYTTSAPAKLMIGAGCNAATKVKGCTNIRGLNDGLDPASFVDITYLGP